MTFWTLSGEELHGYSQGCSLTPSKGLVSPSTNLREEGTPRSHRHRARDCLPVEAAGGGTGLCGPDAGLRLGGFTVLQRNCLLVEETGVEPSKALGGPQAGPQERG